MNFPETYELIKAEAIEEIKGTAYLLHHKKSGAHLLLLDTDDENRVFSVNFQTPPEDDCGVPHILEHSVLCGSEKYPLKDPFVELAKSSVNTFLNAMTAPDKTMYPVASTNEKDFRNLMSVYMDAVFYPNIYREENIFLQEGHHLEFSEDGTLFENGVVYNEMKGVFSDPDSVLERKIKELMFPDTAYRFESGGDPAAIPSLRYETFLDYHRRHYQTKNCYIYLYGKLNFTEHLQWLHENYLSKFTDEGEAYHMELQTPFSEERRATLEYHAETDDADTLFSMTKTIDVFDSAEKSFAFEILSYALLNGLGAPIREALVKAGVAAEVYGGTDGSYRQPIFNIIAKGGKPEDFGRFEKIVTETLLQTAEKGIPKKTLRSALHTIEFAEREADYGRTPKGLMLGFHLFDNWMEDEETAFTHLRYEKPFRFLREKIETDYFENLIREAFLENHHGVLICLRPKKGLLQENEEALRAKTEAFRKSLSEEELKAVRKKAEDLKRYQETPDPEENLHCIPLLSLSDLSEEVRPLFNEERQLGNAKLVYHAIETSGITYLRVHFSLKNLTPEELPYAALLRDFYTMLSTENFSYRELSDEMNLYTGGIGTALAFFDNSDDFFVLTARYLYEDTADALRLLSEILFGTKLRDEKRIREVLQESVTEMKTELVSSGHRTAVRRAFSQTVASDHKEDLTNGIAYYRFLSELLTGGALSSEAFYEKLLSVRDKIFCVRNLLVSLAAEPAGLSETEKYFPGFTAKLPATEWNLPATEWTLPSGNEYFKTFSQVQYNAWGGNFLKKGYSFCGSMLVMKTILGYEYLWQKVRVRGGAYGCMTAVNQNGEMGFVSYRDPNLKKTLEVYEGIADELSSISLTERDLRKYIIGTVGEMDTPLTPSQKATRCITSYLCGNTEEIYKERRRQVLHCTNEDLRALGQVVREVLADGKISVIGSQEKCAEAGALSLSLEEFLKNG